jgi:hypothetical protein
MMDRATWFRWAHVAVQGKRDRTAPLEGLTPEETECLTEVARGPWMLEQERIPLDAAAEALRTAWGIF